MWHGCWDKQSRQLGLVPPGPSWDNPERWFSPLIGRNVVIVVLLFKEGPDRLPLACRSDSDATRNVERGQATKKGHCSSGVWSSLSCFRLLVGQQHCSCIKMEWHPARLLCGFLPILVVVSVSAGNLSGPSLNSKIKMTTERPIRGENHSSGLSTTSIRRNPETSL